MIKIENYVIDTDSYQYIVGELKTCKNKKTGGETEYISRPQYCGSLKMAIQIILNAKQRELVSKRELELNEAISDFGELQERFEGYLKNVKEEL